MPDHFHGILTIGDLLCDGRSRPTATGGTRPAATEMKIKPLGQLRGAFKTVSAKNINLLRATPGVSVWQRDFFERVIRDEHELFRIFQYIQENPANWRPDEFSEIENLFQGEGIVYKSVSG